jgi:hypothetical protein
VRQQLITIPALPTSLLISFSIMKSLDIATMNSIVACLLKARTIKPAEIDIAREQLCKHAH